MDFIQFNELSKEVRQDIALCALVKLLSGHLTNHLMAMARQGKDTHAFVVAHEELINQIASDSIYTIDALRTLMGE